MKSFFVLVLFCLVEWSNCKTCPAKFKRFTPHHTFCLPPNRTCTVISTGVSQQDKELILRLHNQFRSKVAMGNEHRSIGGSLPQAADMMQMEWDDELAAVAQKWTENCKWGHDCNECKAVENFDVGQNLAIQYGQPTSNPDWTWALTVLYDEVKDYYTSWLPSFIKHPGPKTGHLTQLIWSRSWRVGCGYAYYMIGPESHRYYACNYGPGGNVKYEPVYKPGRPCSSCPTNTQCSTRGRNFPGLCKMNNPNTAPAFPRKPNGLFYCGVSRSDPDCQADVSGDGYWNTVYSVGGNYESIVLKGGQSTTVSFTTPIVPRSNIFCVQLKFRKGSLDASNTDQSVFQVKFKMDYSFASPMTLNTETTSFMDYGLNLKWGKKSKLSFTFSVPSGAGEHVLDIRKIEAFDGPCD